MALRGPDAQRRRPGLHYTSNVLRIVDVTSETTNDLRCAVPRADFDVDAAMAAVIPVCSAVRDRGVEALRELSLIHI